MTNGDLVATARDLAETILFPSANRTDVEGRLPRSSLDAIAAGGFYGLMGPKSLGGLEADPTTAGLVIEAFAGGCLTSAFIWAQHHVAVRLMSAASSAIAELWGPKLCAGDIRAGVAFAHLRREGPSPIVAVPEPNRGWRVTGVANWMTGWGAVQVINIAAIHNEQVVWFLADAVEGPTLSARSLALSAVNSSGQSAFASLITSFRPTVSLQSSNFLIGAPETV